MTVCLYVFPTLLSEVRRVHPNLDLKVTVGSTERSIAMLRSGGGDLGLLTLPIDTSDLVSAPVLQEELLVATYPNHPLAMKRRVTPTISTSSPSSCSKPGPSLAASSTTSSHANESRRKS